mmetsp:Transcript_43266/g.128167  ORF Transcript_43266/g.128167 Transcript_43266/m.128167 type:complete len:206 (+) Transcript_43266:1403-2020(+)
MGGSPGRPLGSRGLARSPSNHVDVQRGEGGAVRAPEAAALALLHDLGRGAAAGLHRGGEEDVGHVRALEERAAGAYSLLPGGLLAFPPGPLLAIGRARALLALATAADNFASLGVPDGHGLARAGSLSIAVREGRPVGHAIVVAHRVVVARVHAHLRVHATVLSGRENDMSLDLALGGGGLSAGRHHANHVPRIHGKVGAQGVHR